MCFSSAMCFYFFFFNDTATTEIYTLSLHDALPICAGAFNDNRKTFGVHFRPAFLSISLSVPGATSLPSFPGTVITRGRSGCLRSEEHTSELQSLAYLVCRLLLEKKEDFCLMLLLMV